MKESARGGPAVRVAIGKTSISRRTWMQKVSVLGLTALGGSMTALQGCGGGGGDADNPLPPAGNSPPTTGAHGLSFARINDNVNPLTVNLGTTQASGSTILVSVGRGFGSTQPNSQHALPTDSVGNAPYRQLGTAHAYNLWPNAGTALYAFEGASGANNHQVAVSNTPDFTDEVTLAVVEVKNGGRVQDFSWVERAAAPLTSASVTTTGPATLVAFWWGDGNVALHTAVPDIAFTPIDSLLINAAIVQCAVAVRDVSAAGTYDVTWTATPLQGAQLWLVAVE